MRTISIVIFSLFISGGNFAQQQAKIVETIKGKVINSITNEPVSYTNIGLEGTYYGTASNSEGNFELKIPEEMVSKNIYFSAVGFVNKNFPVQTLFEKEFNVIKIDPQSYDIDDIDVAAQSKVLIRILTMASENIPYNFVAGPFNLSCTYTNNKTINDTTTVIEKADILIYDQTGYSNPSKLDAYQNVKYSLKKEEWKDDYRFSSGTTNMDELLELDWVRAEFSVLNPEILNGFHLELESEKEINGKACWIISFSQEKPTLAGSGDFYALSFNGKITVAKDDYSVLKITGNLQSPKNNPQGKSLAIGKSSSDFPKNISSTFSVEYINLKPELITLNKEYDYSGNKIKENISLKINKVQTTNLTLLDTREYFTGE